MNMKQRIREQASRLFFKKGIRAVTMNDVSEGMGISKRTLYEHFNNKEELLISCIRDEHLRGLQLREDIERETSNTIDIMYRQFRQAVILLREINPDFINELRKIHPDIWENEIEPLEKERDEYIAQLIERGTEQGLFLDNINPSIAAKLLHAQVAIMSDNQVFPADKHALADVFQQIFTVFIRGMATTRGLQEFDKLFNNDKS